MSGSRLKADAGTSPAPAGLSLVFWQHPANWATLPRSRGCAMKRVALAVALLIALAMPSQADFKAGVAAYVRCDYSTSLQ